MKRCLAAILAALLLLPAGCGMTDPPEETLPPTEVSVPTEAPPPPPTEAPRDPLEDMLSQMSLEEKVGQLFFVRVPAEDALADVETYHLGGYILFGRDTKDKTAQQLTETISAWQDASNIPLLIGVDEEGGTVVRVSSNPLLRSQKFSSPQKLYVGGGIEAVLSETAEKNDLLLSLGINVNLAPVADVSTDPADFIYARTLGENAETTAEYTRQVVAAMAEDGIGSVLKHFPGYGSNVDTHTGIAVDERPMETFESSDFLPFRAHTSGNGTAAIMVSHNIITCMDETLPASLSPAVHSILRKQLAFDGVVMTDDLAMDAVAAYAENGAVAVMAIEAGNDMLITTDYRAQIPKVIDAVQNGTLSKDTIDAACLRVLRWKSALGLLPLD